MASTRGKSKHTYNRQEAPRQTGRTVHLKVIEGERIRYDTKLTFHYDIFDEIIG